MKPLTLQETLQLLKATTCYLDLFTTGFLVLTGLRISEFLNLTSASLYEPNRLVFERKGGKQQGLDLQLVPLHLFSLWFAISSHEGKLWPQRTNINYRLRVLQQAAGITKEVSPHALRHTCGTFLLREGEHPIKVQQVLGHSNLATTGRYMAYLPEDYTRRPEPRMSVIGEVVLTQLEQVSICCPGKSCTEEFLLVKEGVLS